ncbi:hypothetical protein BIV59_00100 [Bacillus sp. MUM 13]|nr:hypothetical protein BIV59_00100 [Bacillus sp. MUM 13]
MAVFVNFAAMEQGADFRFRMPALRGAGAHLPANPTLSHLTLQSTRFNNRIASQNILKQQYLRKEPLICLIKDL